MSHSGVLIYVCRTVDLKAMWQLSRGLLKMSNIFIHFSFSPGNFLRTQSYRGEKTFKEIMDVSSLCKSEMLYKGFWNYEE